MKPVEINDALLAILLGTPGPKDCRGLPSILWGSPGSAKTTRLEKAAEELGEACVVLTPQHDETTYGIVPVYDRTTGLIRTPPHEWVEQLGESGVLVLDDLTSHDGAVHAAQLRLLTHRETGSAKLGRNVSVLGIANPIAQASNGHPLSHALASRCIHLQVTLPWAETAQYLLDMDQAVFPRLRRLIHSIRDGWEQAFALERRRMAGFVTTRGPALDSEDVRDDIDCVIKASSRTIELCVRAVTAARIIQEEQLIPALVAGSIGRGHAGAYVEYSSQQNLPTDEQIINGWKPAYGQSDIVFLSLARLVNIIKSADAAAKHALVTRYWDLVALSVRPATEGGAQVPPDVIVPSAKACAKMGFYPPAGAPSKILREVVL